MFKIKNLSASIEEKKVLQCVSLEIEAGETHVILGPNGSGKSTLVKAISDVATPVSYDADSMEFNGESILDTGTAQRMQKGIFLAYQNPIDVPGVSNLTLLVAATNSKRRARGESDVEISTLLAEARRSCKQLGLGTDFLSRPVNFGMSGGEKKKNEMLQMLMLQPQLAMLDEIDSGLDVDATDAVAKSISLRQSEGGAFIIISHYERLLSQVKIDKVHIMNKGQLVATGGRELIEIVNKDGFNRWSN